MAKIPKHGFRSHWSIVHMMERIGGHLRRGLRRWQARRTAAALESLPEGILKDIGITRAEIPALALRVTAPTTSTATRSYIRSRWLAVRGVVT